MSVDLFKDINAWESIPTNELANVLPSFFEYMGDIEKTAILNWRFGFIRDTENQFYEMGKAYLQTAIQLIDDCMDNNWDKKADVWIFPILFNTVHGIEIYLKGFNSQIMILDKIEKNEYQDSTLEQGHNIQNLCRKALNLIKISSHTDLLPEFEFINKFIDILYSNTNDMTFARYPTRNKGDAQFYVKQQNNINIDLDVIRIWVCKILSILDGCTSFVDYQIDQINDWLYEMQQDCSKEWY